MRRRLRAFLPDFTQGFTGGLAGLGFAGCVTVVVFGVMLAVAVACGAGREGGPGVYPATGNVIDVDASTGQVVIEHDDIPGLMPAMTMNFDVADHALLERLAPGQRISFQLEFTGRSYRVAAAEVIGSGGSRGARLGLNGAAREDQLAPSFALVDQAGRPLALEDLRGKVLLLDFVYTSCPGPCPILTGLHAQVQRALSARARGRARFVSISLDPARDTPEAMRRYAEARRADLTGWSFLTGDVDAVGAVLDAYGVGRASGADDEVEHLIVTYLIDGDGVILKRYLGLEHEYEDLVRDLERATS